MALASFNFSINSSTSSTLIPAWRWGGSSTFNVSKRLEMSTPKSSAFNFSKGFFLAFMMLGNEAYRGSFNRKSVVTIMGKAARKVSAPPSTSSVTSTLSPSISTLDALVAWGQFNKPAKIWPVWLASSSIDCLPKITKLDCSFSTTFCNNLATANGSTSVSPTSINVVESAPLARAVLKISWALVGPMETAWIFSTRPLLASSIFKDSSKAMSQNGFMSNLTPLVSTPVPALLISGLMAKSMTRFTGTKIFNFVDIASACKASSCTARGTLETASCCVGAARSIPLVEGEINSLPVKLFTGSLDAASVLLAGEVASLLEGIACEAVFFFKDGAAPIRSREAAALGADADDAGLADLLADTVTDSNTAFTFESSFSSTFSRKVFNSRSPVIFIKVPIISVAACRIGSCESPNNLTPTSMMASI